MLGLCLAKQQLAEIAVLAAREQENNTPMSMSLHVNLVWLAMSGLHKQSSLLDFTQTS